MMRKELYDAIKAKISSDVPEVKHVDLWNHNVEFIEQEEGWERPAVFVEFCPIVWSPLKSNAYRGKGTVNVHLVTDWTEGGQEAAFVLSQKVSLALDGLDGETFGGMALAETATNHNHEEILESIDTYAVRYQLEA